MNWNIITDSSCDLLPSSSPDGGIRLTSVPFTIRIGERDFVDDEHLDTMEMLSAMEQERSASHTSCPTPDAWLAQFEQADCAIAITISSQLSGSMIGRGFIADPALLRRARGGTGASREELRGYLDDLYHGYTELFGSAGSAVSRMKAHWFYLIHRFAGSEKLEKQLRKAREPWEYEVLVNQIFTLPML